MTILLEIFRNIAIFMQLFLLFVSLSKSIRVIFPSAAHKHTNMQYPQLRHQ